MARQEHRFTQRRLDRFVDDELEGDDVDRVTVHMLDCPECSAGVRFLLRLRASLLDLTRQPTNADL